MKPVVKKVAITIDDLPGASFPLSIAQNEEQILEINHRLVSGLVRHGAPAVGFVAANSVDICAIPAPSQLCLERVLDIWLSAGLEIGNHTDTHRMLDTIDSDQFCQDILVGHNRLIGSHDGLKPNLKYFRHPYLRTGATSAMKNEVYSFLNHYNYQVAPVTIYAEDWAFAEAYACAHSQDDQARKLSAVERYLKFTDDAINLFEDLSEKVLGYQVSQIFLIHNNYLNAYCLDSIIQLFRDRNYKFISLEEALQDPAYERGDPYVGQESLTWLERWAGSAPNATQIRSTEPTDLLDYAIKCRQT